MLIDAKDKLFGALNDELCALQSDVEIENCLGQRFIAAGARNKRVVINGIPGNALGAYLAGAEIEVNGNAQDAVGDTMNDGSIVVHGNVGDAVGYAMRGGVIYVSGNAGYRAGIHMKEYKSKKPVIIIGGRTGSFLGEYQAGGIIIVLGMHGDGKPIVGNFPCAGMHGGKVFLRGDASNVSFPCQTTTRPAGEDDWKEIMPHLLRYCDCFKLDGNSFSRGDFTVVVPNSSNPYKQMYVAN